MIKPTLYEVEIRSASPTWVYYGARDTEEDARVLKSLLEKRGLKARIVEFSTNRKVLK
jgi:hypothetical protein